MTAIERTAYPRFKNSYRKNELQLYLPSDSELEYMQSHDIRSDTMRLNFMVQLKIFQRMGYFQKISNVPKIIQRVIRQALGISKKIKASYPHNNTNYRHRKLIRDFLKIDNDNKTRDELIQTLAKEAGQTMNDPANIINFVLEELVKRRYGLPAFSQLDRTVCAIRHTINEGIFNHVHSQIQQDNKDEQLLQTLEKNKTDHKTPYHQFKRLPQRPTVTHFKELVAHHDLLLGFDDFATYLAGISTTKFEQFAEEARALSANSMKEMRNLDKKITLIACLLAQAQCQTKDALALTFCRCVHGSEKDAERHYFSLDKNKDEAVASIAELLLGMTTGYKNKKLTKAGLLKLFDKHYEQYGGTEKVIQDCEKLLKRHNNKHYPLIWQHYRSKRTGVFSFFKSIQLGSIKKDKPLLAAIKTVENIRDKKKYEEWVELDAPVDLSFASKDWQHLIAKKNGRVIHAHYFEICVMFQLREKLRTGDVYIKGADAYGDYRKTLLP